MLDCYLLAAFVPPPQASQWSSRQKEAKAGGQKSPRLAAAYEHALLHRAMQVPAQCTADQRRVDTRLLSWQALSGGAAGAAASLLWLEPTTANGVTGSPSPGGLSRCTSWSSDSE
ncbi:hypothetical protein ACHAQJ_006774 [Trichoderma viride]